MRYLFTTKPDEGCHEVEPGIFGRPVQACDEPKLKKQGWTLTVEAQRGNTDVRQAKEERQEESQEVDDDREMWAAAYEQKFGKKPHHKLKTDKIRAKVESDD